MTSDQQAKLRAILMRLGAEDLALEVAAVFDVRDLDEDVRGAIIDTLGAEAAARGFDSDGRVNALGRELDELAEALGLALLPNLAPIHAPGLSAAHSPRPRSRVRAGGRRESPYNVHERGHHLPDKPLGHLLAPDAE